MASIGRAPPFLGAPPDRLRDRVAHVAAGEDLVEAPGLIEPVAVQVIAAEACDDPTPGRLLDVHVAVSEGPVAEVDDVGPQVDDAPVDVLADDMEAALVPDLGAE